jgi:cellulose biosynthesis protein BcsQ
VITAFYSFKGGVGRTLATVHVARRLARGLRQDAAGEVLVVDFDLEAPGLDPYFGHGASPKCGGLALLLKRLQGKRPGERAAWLRSALRDPRYVVRHPKLPLRFLPSGLGDIRATDAPGYSAVAAWLRELIDEPEGGRLVEFRSALTETATYVLVDSRTGLADESYLSTVLLPDALVLLFRPSRLHLDGVEQVYRNFLDHKGIPVGDPRAPVIPVLSPLPNRGGTDIARYLDEEVPRVFAWESSDGLGPEEKVNAPLVRWERNRLVRLYAEPAIELGETTIVDEQGRWASGFDGETPLGRGYVSLVARLRALNFRKDWRGADRLAHHWDSLSEDPLAGLYLVERLRQRFDAEADDTSDFALKSGTWLTVVGPALEALILGGDDRPHVAAALAEIGAMRVMDAEVTGEALAKAIAWVAVAPDEAAAHYPIHALFTRFRKGLPQDASRVLQATVETMENRLDTESRPGAVRHAALASLRLLLRQPVQAASLLARVVPDGFRAQGEADARLLAQGAAAGWALGALPLLARFGALDPSEHRAAGLAMVGWYNRLREDGTVGAAAELAAAIAVDVPRPAENATRTAVGANWLAAVLGGNTGIALDDDAAKTLAGQFSRALNTPGVPSNTPLPAMDRASVGWHFAIAWVGGTLQIPVVTPPSVEELPFLSVTMFDALRMGLFGAAHEDEALVDAADSLLARILSVAPGLGVPVRRIEGGRAPLLAAYHLERMGRLSPRTIALVARLRDRLYADEPTPEPPLDDLGFGYELDPARLAAAAELVTAMPKILEELTATVHAVAARAS